MTEHVENLTTEYLKARLYELEDAIEYATNQEIERGDSIVYNLMLKKREIETELSKR